MTIAQRAGCLLAAAVTSVALLSPTVAGQDSITAATLTDEHVQRAIGAMVQELYARKDPVRFWEPAKLPTGESKQRGGYSALVVLALLSAGETFQDPRLRDAVSYLEKVGMDGTYAVSMRANVWALLPPKFNELLADDTKWLVDGFSEGVGGWTYRQNPNTTRRDNSITQFGALAFWEAAKRGLGVDTRYWRMIEDRFLDMQLADGGWNYTGDGQSTGSMTAAGLATLFITQDLLHSQEYVAINPNRQTPSQVAIADALKWMDEHFAPDENPNRLMYYYYYLYAVERAGLASGYKFFGGHDWYRQATAELLRLLCTWDPTTREMTVNRRIANEGRAAQVRASQLAFALLFLSRGRVPVAINKLQDASAAWNNRPRDVANLTAWLQATTEGGLNWQIVDLQAEPHDWLDAPMLYFASHQRLGWLDQLPQDIDTYVRQMRQLYRARAAGEIADEPQTPTRPKIERLDKLRAYLDLGGLLFAVNEGEAHAFADSIEKIGRVMYPQYDWRTLPEDHWAYTILLPVQNKRPTLRGLSNGVRELIILAPTTDFSATFQARLDNERSHYRTAANIYFYASELNRPRPRLAPHFVATAGNTGQRADDDPNDDMRFEAALATATIVRAIHADNWDAEPQALNVFSAAMRQEHEFAITLLDHPLSRIDQLDPPPDLVVASGIDEHHFTGPQRNALRAYVDAGGVVLFETPGGRGPFTLSAEQACTEIFKAPIRSLFRHRIVTGQGLRGAAHLSRLEYRPFSFEVFGARETTPRLRGMIIDGQPRVLFSREDLSHALLDQPCWGIAGYQPNSARRLLGNIVRYALALSPQ